MGRSLMIYGVLLGMAFSLGGGVIPGAISMTLSAQQYGSISSVAWYYCIAGWFFFFVGCKILWEIHGGRLP